MAINSFNTTLIIVFVNIFSGQINDDNEIIEGEVFFLYDSKTVCSLMSIVHKTSVRGRRTAYIWLQDKESGGQTPDIVIPITRWAHAQSAHEMVKRN